jgi:hypothetical protein
LGAKWSAQTEIGQLRATSSALRVENGNYRETTGELTTQIQSLETVIDDLGARAALDPAQARAMQSLPAVVKARAAGGEMQTSAAISNILSSSFASPEDTFGVLKSLLQGLENRLSYVRRNVERQEALAAATPSIWPTFGWLTGTFGGRDPFTGEPASSGPRYLDRERQSGFATAAGPSVGGRRRLRQPVVLSTISACDALWPLEPLRRRMDGSPRRRDRLRRSTGRSTGRTCTTKSWPGKLINPLQLLTSRPRDRPASRPVDDSPAMLQSLDSHSDCVL